MSRSPRIQFRPHHFLCTLGFRGKGYSEEFVENFQEIADHLRESPQGDRTSIEIVESTDSICAPCPNRRGQECETEAKIRKLDGAHAATLGIHPGETLTWGEAKERIAARVSDETFEKICEPCSWRSLGVCQEALSELRRRKSSGALALFLAIALVFGATDARAAPNAKKKKPAITRALAEEETLPEGRTDESLTATPAPSDSPTFSPSPSPTPAPTPTPTASPAASPSPPAAPTWPTHAKKSLALWKNTLPKKAPKAARELNRALKAIADVKYSQARKIVKPFLAHATYADHALFLDGKASVLHAKGMIGKTPAEADRLARGAIESFEKIRSLHLLSPWYSRVPEFIGQAEMIRGRALVASKKYPEAMAVFERGFQRLLIENAIHLATSEALDAYTQACLKKRNNLCEAWVLRLANQFSKNTLESRTLAQTFKDIVNVAKPNFANSKVTTGYRQKDSDELAFEPALQLVVQQKWRDGSKALRNFLDEYPRSTHRHRARFWLARSVEEHEGFEDAKPLYEAVAKESPLTFHGLLSQWKLAQDPLTRYSSSSPTLQESDVFQSPQEVVRVSRARELIVAGAFDLASVDLKDLRPRDTASGGYLLYLSGLSSLAGSYLASFVSLTELIQRSDEIVYSADMLDIAFPTVAEALIRKTVTAVEIDPILVMSLIKQESGFERDIHSSVGASGYMQLMPFTASDVEPDVKREDLLDAETNVRIGSKYLKRMISRYNGNVAIALAAYNAGPTAADRWIRDGRADLGFLEFVEQIPYKETRDYVGTIFRNYVYYQRKLEGKTVTTTEAFWPANWKPKK